MALIKVWLKFWVFVSLSTFLVRLLVPRTHRPGPVDFLLSQIRFNTYLYVEREREKTHMWERLRDRGEFSMRNGLTWVWEARSHETELSISFFLLQPPSPFSQRVCFYYIHTPQKLRLWLGTSDLWVSACVSANPSEQWTLDKRPCNPATSAVHLSRHFRGSVPR